MSIKLGVDVGGTFTLDGLINADGIAGTGYGSGGGGAFSNSADVAGGSGKDGVVIITEF